MKILVTGSRSCMESDKVVGFLNENIDKDNDIVIHGGANSGVDAIADWWCVKFGVRKQVFRPLYADKRIYYLHRNAEMVGMCDKCLVIWDGVSSGTKFTFDYANARGKVKNILMVHGGDERLMKYGTAGNI